MPQWLVIGISGVTCGGKTTLATNLRDYFQNNQNLGFWNTGYIIGDIQVINQDDYFLPVDDLRHKWIDKLNAINFDVITSLDMKQMLSDITWYMKGRYLAMDPIENIDYMNEISMSISFDHHSPHHHHNQNFSHHHHQQQHQHQHQHHFLTQHQQQQQQRQTCPSYHSHNVQHLNPIIVQNHSPQILSHLRTTNNMQHPNAQEHGTKINILIIEGFIIFSQPELLKICQLKFHFHLPYEKCFSRRKTRTYEPPDVTGYFEMCVWPMYEKYFSEFRDRKDITMLNGEISKEQMFKFVLNRIGSYLAERDICSIPSKNFSFSMSNNNNGACPMDHQ